MPTAIDLSSAMVARLNQRLAPYPECKALVMDGEALTFEDSTFDAAFSVLATTLFSNWSAGLDEAVRLTERGTSEGLTNAKDGYLSSAALLRVNLGDWTSQGRLISHGN